MKKIEVIFNLPKKNPKHDTSISKNRTGVVQYRKRKLKRKYLYISIIAVLVIIPIVISASLLSKQGGGIATVQIGDNVTIHYKLWISDSNGAKNTFLQDQTFNITIKSTATETGLIEGFYNALIGMANGSINPYLYVPAGSGYTTTQIVTDPNGVQHNLDNVPLVFWIQIDDISQPSS